MRVWFIILFRSVLEWRIYFHRRFTVKQKGVCRDFRNLKSRNLTRFRATGLNIRSKKSQIGFLLLKSIISWVHYTISICFILFRLFGCTYQFSTITTSFCNGLLMKISFQNPRIVQLGWFWNGISDVVEGSCFSCSISKRMTMKPEYRFKMELYPSMSYSYATSLIIDAEMQRYDHSSLPFP